MRVLAVKTRSFKSDIFVSGVLTVNDNTICLAFEQSNPFSLHAQLYHKIKQIIHFRLITSCESGTLQGR